MLAIKAVPTVISALLTDVATLAIPVVKKVVLLTVELTVLLPIDKITVVSLTLAPTFAAKLKFPVLVDNDVEFTCVFTLLLPICNVDVVKLTFAPTLAPVLKLPVVIVSTVLLTTAVPIVKLKGDKFAIDELFATLSKIEFANIFEVLLPIWRSDVVRLTFEPTLAPITKLPTLTVIVELLALNEPTTNPVDDMFAVDVLSATDIKTELAFKLTVLFPIVIPDVETPTLDPTLALVLKIPTLVKTDDEFTKEFTLELPTRIDDVAAVRLAMPVDVTVVLFATKFDPTV